MAAITRKAFLGASASLLLANCAPKAEEPWPRGRPLQFVVPFSAGSGFDSYVRALVAPLQAELGQGARVVPENVPGAGGSRGGGVVYRAKPDGYTIGMFNLPGATVSAVRGDRLPYELNRITWLANLGTDRYAVVVRAQSPLRSIEDVFALQRPLKLAQLGPNSSDYVCAQVAFGSFDRPYRIVTGYQGSSETTIAVLRGEVDASVRPISSVLSYVESGDVRLLLTLEDKPSVAGVPCSTDIGYPQLAALGLERMIGGPPDMADEIVARLSDVIVRAAHSEVYLAWARAARTEVNAIGADEAREKERELAAFYLGYRDMLALRG